jgi:hypothetical protein
VAQSIPQGRRRLLPSIKGGRLAYANVGTIITETTRRQLLLSRIPHNSAGAANVGDVISVEVCSTKAPSASLGRAERPKSGFHAASGLTDAMRP